MPTTEPEATSSIIIESYDVLGIPISVVNLDRASATLHRWAHDDLGRFICVRDVHGIVQAVDNPDLMALHAEAAMVTPDGLPLVWLGQQAGRPVSRTCGPDLMDRVMRDSAKSGLKHYFYGGKPGVVEILKERFVAKYPGLQVVKIDTPPFRDLSELEFSNLVSDLKASKADIVWIGVSTPKQEFLMRDLYSLVPCTLIGVGAAFDFHAGLIRRAPKWMQKSGLEWAFRLATEPARLWRRYLIMAPRFVWMLLRKRNV